MQAGHPPHDAAWPHGEDDDDPAGPVFEAALVPYHDWANRGSSTMQVCIPVTT